MPARRPVALVVSSLVLVIVAGITGFLTGLAVTPPRIVVTTLFTTPPAVTVTVTSTVTREVAPGAMPSMVEVQIYHGTSSSGTINMVLEDWARVYEGIVSGCGRLAVRLVILGATTCPYCKVLKEFLEAGYPNITCVLWVDADAVAARIFTFVGYLEAQSGFLSYARSVPQTVVMSRDGVARAIVVGAVTDRGFWDGLLSR